MNIKKTWLSKLITILSCFLLIAAAINSASLSAKEDIPNDDILVPYSPFDDWRASVFYQNCMTIGGELVWFHTENGYYQNSDGTYNVYIFYSDDRPYSVIGYHISENEAKQMYRTDVLHAKVLAGSDYFSNDPTWNPSP